LIADFDKFDEVDVRDFGKPKTMSGGKRASTPNVRKCGVKRVEECSVVLYEKTAKFRYKSQSLNVSEQSSLRKQDLMV